MVIQRGFFPPFKSPSPIHVKEHMREAHTKKEQQLEGPWLHHIRLPKENQPKSHEKEDPKSNTHKLKINPENQQRTRLRIKLQNSYPFGHLHLKSTQNSSNPIMAKPLIQQLKHQFNPSIISTKNHNPRYFSISFG